MPKKVYQCTICNHTSEKKSVIESCEKSHRSIKKEKTVELYSDMYPYPYAIRVVLKNEILVYRLDGVVHHA